MNNNLPKRSEVSTVFKELKKKIIFDKSSCLEANQIFLNLLLPGSQKISNKYSKLSIKKVFTIALDILSISIKNLGVDFNREEFTRDFITIAALVEGDIEAAFNKDPAATSKEEVLYTYPGLLAVTCHRIAHILYSQNTTIIPRVISEWAHSKTGIDIHPGAKIGNCFFIDHGTGVVIGETAEIGNNVTIYQGVTLGAKNFPLDEKGLPVKGAKRHPTLEDDVIIYANTIILGGDTKIGKNTTIGGNLFITESIPKNSLVLSQALDKEPTYKIISKR